MYLIYDTETNGLHGTEPHLPAVINQPRLTQLGFILLDNKFREVTRYNQLIYPDGWTIPNYLFFIENGHSTQRCFDFGVPVHEALTRFRDAVDCCKFTVAHNAAFDYRVIVGELIRAKVTPAHKPQHLCSMVLTTEFVNLPGKKKPKLIELYRHLFNEDFDGAHDAMADVEALTMCFIELVQRGVIVPGAG